MDKSRCQICNAKHGANLVWYRSRLVCQECAHEYAAIFEGYVSNNRKKRTKKPTEHSEIPKEVLDYYNKLLLDEPDPNV